MDTLIRFEPRKLRLTPTIWVVLIGLASSLAAFVAAHAWSKTASVHALRWMPVATAFVCLLSTALLALVIRHRRVVSSTIEATARALRDERERAQVTLESLAEGVISTDELGAVRYVNPVAQALTGWPPEEATGRALGEVLHLIDEDTRLPLECIHFEDRGIQPMEPPVHCALINRFGVERSIAQAVSVIRPPRGNVQGVVVVFSDITSARRVERELHHRATHDGLTGLLNRRAFEELLEEHLSQDENGPQTHAIGIVDLDRFKVVNDTCGHAAGDELLRSVAILLRTTVRRRDAVARLGGDEFGILFRNCSLDVAERRLQAIVSTVGSMPFTWNDARFTVSLSAGLAALDPASSCAARAMVDGDRACYAAKRLGRNRLSVLVPGERADRFVQTDIQRAMRLSSALDQDRLGLVAQQIVPLAQDDDRLRFEVLLRLAEPGDGWVAAGPLIQDAERHGLMARIDRWVIRTTLETVAASPCAAEQIELSINLSATSLADPTLLDFVIEQLSATGVSPEQLCFEITETAAVANLEQAVFLMKGLKRLGCRFALDDFGAGTSSFGSLKDLPVDTIKIAGNFVRDMAENQVDRAMVAAVAEIGHELGLETVAEWVEHDEHITSIRAMGIDFAQGYAYGLPRQLDVTLAEHGASMGLEN